MRLRMFWISENSDILPNGLQVTQVDLFFTIDSFLLLVCKVSIVKNNSMTEQIRFCINLNTLWQFVITLF